MAAQVAESCYVTRVHQVIDDGDAFFPKWTTQFPDLLHSVKTTGGSGTRVSFEIWGVTRSLVENGTSRSRP
ncbi:dihydrofolate reductase [Phytophthora boehmeriae]|uniref:Dihydrofolate reductase n=1 Tax=Phytophthora boehmeriae TaxID=109152 RepID=A0A8T1WTN7_9STRA|nr:dihydrofolate reductase [Phytophthora boehmeriae]